jgi:hypothetical protein
METVLTLSLGGFPPLSARGCEQILEPIKLGQMQRTVNGELIHLGSQALKYQSVIKAKDRTVLALNGLCPGVVVKVGCVQPLWEPIEDTADGYHLMRDAVNASIAVIDSEQNAVDFSTEGNTIYIEDDTEDREIFVTYRPELTMRVLDFLIKTNEWTFESSWELSLEEI